MCAGRVLRSTGGFFSGGLRVGGLPFATELGAWMSTHTLGGAVLTEWPGALATRFWLWWPRFLPCDQRATSRTLVLGPWTEALTPGPDRLATADDSVTHVLCPFCSFSRCHPHVLLGEKNRRTAMRGSSVSLPSGGPARRWTWKEAFGPNVELGASVALPPCLNSFDSFLWSDIRPRGLSHTMERNV